MVSRHYFPPPHPSQYVQPFILHPLIPAALLPYLVDIAPLLPFSCCSLLSSPHPISSTTCLSPPTRPLTVRTRAPTVFPSFSQPPRLIPVPVNLQLPARRLTQTCAVYNHLPDTFPCLPNLQLPATCLTHTHAAYNHPQNSFSCLSCPPTRTLLLYHHS